MPLSDDAAEARIGFRHCSFAELLLNQRRRRKRRGGAEHVSPNSRSGRTMPPIFKAVFHYGRFARADGASVVIDCTRVQNVISIDFIISDFGALV